VAHLGALSLGLVAGASELVTLAALRGALEVAPAGGEVERLEGVESCPDVRM
jgi:hypothetical protein